MNIEEMNNRSFELAEAHWEYIEGLLKAHYIEEYLLSVARFHYKEAFMHGYKHCYQDNRGNFRYE
jgi:hypothetical protein